MWSAAAPFNAVMVFRQSIKELAYEALGYYARKEREAGRVVVCLAMRDRRRCILPWRSIAIRGLMRPRAGQASG